MTPAQERRHEWQPNVKQVKPEAESKVKAQKAKEEASKSKKEEAKQKVSNRRKDFRPQFKNKSISPRGRFHLKAEASRFHLKTEASRFHLKTEASRFHLKTEASRFHLKTEASRFHKIYLWGYGNVICYANREWLTLASSPVRWRKHHGLVHPLPM